MQSDYTVLKQAIESAGYFTTPMPMDSPGDRIVLASIKDDNGLTGNSFWVATRRGKWYLGTWGCHLYCIPRAEDVAQLCLKWLPMTNLTQWDIDEALKQEFGLKELSEAEVADVFPARVEGD